MNYREGDIIQITLLKETGLNEAEKFYLFRSNQGDKFLLDKSQYSNYTFELGKTITARIDRINCSGRIFIEPEHPVYKDLQAYDFEILKRVSVSEKEADIIVKDCFGNDVPVKVLPFKTNTERITLGVAFVRKGIPILYDPNLDTEFDYKERKIYDFTILKFQKDSNGDDEIVLSDSEGIQQFIPANFYKHYNLKPGQNITCEVVRIRPGRQLSLEPVHPFYKIGETLNLRYDAKMTKQELQHHRHILHKLNNEKGDVFLISDRFLTEELKKGMHQYEIDAFKKGQVYVKPIL